MQLDELASEGQPEPGALDLLVRRPNLAKLLKDRLLILRRDAYPAIADGHFRHALVHRGADIDPAALGRELERVGQQIQEHLLDLPLVGPDRAEILVDRAAKRDAPADRALTHQDQRVLA